MRVQFDKKYLTDECYYLHETTDLTLKGIKENILKARDFLQTIVRELEVQRIYMSAGEIKVIITNLISIKQTIHPSEVRCSRDNALRDINHPFFTIYYKDKEVAFVGTKKYAILSQGERHGDRHRSGRDQPRQGHHTQLLQPKLPPSQQRQRAHPRHQEPA